MQDIKLMVVKKSYFSSQESALYLRLYSIARCRFKGAFLLLRIVILATTIDLTDIWCGFKARGFLRIQVQTKILCFFYKKKFINIYFHYSIFFYRKKANKFFFLRFSTSKSFYISKLIFFFFK